MGHTAVVLNGGSGLELNLIDSGASQCSPINYLTMFGHQQPSRGEFGKVTLSW